MNSPSFKLEWFLALHSARGVSAAQIEGFDCRFSITENSNSFLLTNFIPNVWKYNTQCMRPSTTFIYRDDVSWCKVR